ncbi:MAG: hypothetical protein M1540_06190 [Candidatus Bathyarchaeota archaeon]|nr:hypothetical protein [Gammaproteobacteria bacterium]MCL5877384.1 hypothetical protein [Candidatus Bathyarchaeota archaeon]
MKSNQSKAKQVSIMAMTAALFAIFFYLSKLISLPTFTFLYLPIILLGVIPIWFGWGGLIGSMLGAYIGGVYVESLPLHLAWVEVTTVVIIYALNWLLIPRFAAEAKTLKGLIVLGSVYALSLLVGTIAILWQFVAVGLFPAEIAWPLLPGTFALNLPIVIIACPALIRAISPRLHAWGVYAGGFAGWRARKATPNPL